LFSTAAKEQISISKCKYKTRKKRESTVKDTVAELQRNKQVIKNIKYHPKKEMWKTQKKRCFENASNQGQKWKGKRLTGNPRAKEEYVVNGKKTIW
jgi:hypothetical protein